MNDLGIKARRMTAAELIDTVLDLGSLSSRDVPVKIPPISDKYATDLITAAIDRATTAGQPLLADRAS